MREYLADLNRLEQPTTREHECELARRARAGETAAMNELIERNLRLVVAIAKSEGIRRRAEAVNLPLCDLVAEGNRGLIEAAHKFDENRGCRLAAYAKHWINMRIKHAIRDATLIHVPAYLQPKMAAWQEDPPEAGSKDAEFFYAARAAAVSNCRPFGYGSLEDRKTSGAAAEDEEGTRRDEVLRHRRGLLREAMEKLPERDQRVIEARYGLDGREPLPLAVIANVILGGRTKERARQVVDLAVRKLRSELASAAAAQNAETKKQKEKKEGGSCNSVTAAAGRRNRRRPS